MALFATGTELRTYACLSSYGRKGVSNRLIKPPVRGWGCSADDFGPGGVLSGFVDRSPEFYSPEGSLQTKVKCVRTTTNHTIVPRNADFREPRKTMVF